MQCSCGRFFTPPQTDKAPEEAYLLCHSCRGYDYSYTIRGYDHPETELMFDDTDEYKE